MNKLISFLVALSVLGLTSVRAQTPINVQKTSGTNALTAPIVIPSGQTFQVASGATANFTGATIVGLTTGGTVQSFNAGNLSPLFTTSVATSTTTPLLTFNLSNAAQNAVFAGPATGGAGPAAYRALAQSDMPFNQASLTEATSSVLTITGGTNAVMGSGTAIQVKQASTSQSGYLSNTDWNTFNGKASPGSYITALTGDGTATGPGSSAFTLATVNTNVGTFAGSTLNGKGQATAATAITSAAGYGIVNGAQIDTWGT